MKEMPYSKREIDSHFESIKGILANQNIVLGEIKEQVKTTNGRVNRLENWRWLLIGGGSVILFLLTGIIIPIVIGYF